MAFDVRQALRGAGRGAFIVLAAALVAACQNAHIGGAVDDRGSGAARVGDRDGDLRVVSTLAVPDARTAADRITIAENDLLQIDVFQVDELDRTVRVDARGNIALPLIGQVEAAGLTVPELETSLEQRYGQDYLQAPEVSVFVAESFGQRVTMDGEFRRPGIYPVASRTTLLQTVAQAGGLTDIADQRRLYVFRGVGGEKQVASYSLADIRAGRASDPPVYGGDVVVAFASGMRIATRNLREALGIAVSASSVAAPF